IREAARGNAPAAATTVQSRLVVPESAMLDIRDAITYEAWVQVPAYQTAVVIWNQGQYALGIDVYGRPTCWIGDFAAMATQPLGTDTWRHDACVFDGRSLSVYLAGNLARCGYRQRPIPTVGATGTRLASNLVGAIDDVRIYARALTAPEICRHADKTDCTA